MNNHTHIRSLISRYYDGNITPSQLDELYRFFRNAPTDLPDDMIAECDMFNALLRIKEHYVEVPSDLEKRLSDSIESASNRQKAPRIMLWKRIITAAAMLAIAIGIGVTLLTDKPQHLPAESYINIAYTPQLPSAGHTAQAREITDPEEAARYISFAQNILRKNIDKANENCLLAQNRISKINSVINNILK